MIAFKLTASAFNSLRMVDSVMSFLFWEITKTALNPIKDGGGEGGQKDPPTSFPLTFSFNPFATLV